LITAEAVRFGGYDQVGALHLLQGGDQHRVALLRGDVGVDQADAEGKLLALVQIGFDECGPLRGDRLRDFGVAVAGQVGEDERGPGGELLWCALVQRKEVDGACAAWSGGDLRFFGAKQRVDERRFADVGAAQEGDLRGVGGAVAIGEVLGAGRGEKELWNETHRFELTCFWRYFADSIRMTMCGWGQWSTFQVAGCIYEGCGTE
jgi:hypothetical protein